MGEEQHIFRLDGRRRTAHQTRTTEEDNANVHKTVQQMAFQVEELDKEKRKRRNLLFFGISRQEGVACEQLVREVFQDDLKITEGIVIDQAYRVGNAILVKVPVPDPQSTHAIQGQTPAA